MAWTGKVIGGVLGSLIGPLGTAIGIGIGHQFDKGAEKVKVTGMMIQVAFFGCLAKMARADGTIHKEEIAAVEQIMAKLGYKGKMREDAIAIFRKAKDDSHTAADYINQLAASINYSREIGLTFLTALHAVAQADGFIHPNEHEILLQTERAFRFRPGTVDAMLGGPRKNADNAYKVLDCTPEMTDAEIKSAYRKKCVEFHPDKLASKGLPDEFMQYAHDQLTEINEAYDVIKTARQPHNV